ncbi:MAG: ABC transporter ATP-binding protein [Thermodesulfobacteriota bacterium]|nr:ABC transporter ATP-binding protein [Thermodesulfobacteriota bacterium]
MKDDVLISVRGMHKSFIRGSDVIDVLSGIDLDVRKGECIAITGPSGSGKSTLLNLLGGLDRPQTGSICYAGRDITTMGEGELAIFRNLTIGFVFQFHFLLPEFTAVENVMIPALISFKDEEDLRQRAVSLLERVGLKDRIAHRPGELSGGEQQRVALARALMMSPEVLLADEPTGDLDPGTGEKMIGLLSEMKRSMDITMVVVTHNPVLATIMDKVMILKERHLEPFSI